MGKKDKRWILQRKKDYYYNLAKKNKYRSRASYKLFQLNSKFKIIKEGNVVVDLGCAPGGWLQIAREIVGEKGFVVGVDLQSVKPLPYENVKTIKGDMTKDETLEKLRSLLSSDPDVVICDASPNISGVWDVDHTRSIELTTMALMTATKLLKTGGNFTVKVFQGDLFDQYVKLVKNYFEKVYTTKPKASRDESAELYVIGKRFLGKKFDMDMKLPILKLLKPEDEEKTKENKFKTKKSEQGLLIKKIKEMRKEK
ncbi:MAG: rRNA (uridine2552-2-O)-methyltransferase [Methanothermococcus sp.]|jgi:23S rRNA (uridine2552-2'-O)-methyltransferase|uniref:RlmE family RNA methyltransferase n=1 Tax=Methanothermococcus TaxID=155862 RepID=UPI0003752772|nr:MULTISPECIES: RlmE family RNA methyltransferase [Methanothermococcus]MDK2791024.1 rRNA (uridine2552-2-O)-methyltransferase [Methanothermococcus sp.]MDK2987896.1 rRNA (uridine2552-2-O)-methyltransferase [Methanothermococcus sp.]